MNTRSFYSFVGQRDEGHKRMMDKRGGKHKNKDCLFDRCALIFSLFHETDLIFFPSFFSCVSPASSGLLWRRQWKMYTLANCYLCLQNWWCFSWNSVWFTDRMISFPLNSLTDERGFGSLSSATRLFSWSRRHRNYRQTTASERKRAKTRATETRQRLHYAAKGKRNEDITQSKTNDGISRRCRSSGSETRRQEDGRRNERGREKWKRRDEREKRNPTDKWSQNCATRLTLKETHHLFLTFFSRFLNNKTKKKKIKAQPAQLHGLSLSLVTVMMIVYYYALCIIIMVSSSSGEVKVKAKWERGVHVHFKKWTKDIIMRERMIRFLIFKPRKRKTS